MEVVEMYKVTYSVKDNNGYINDKVKKLVSFSDAVKLVRTLNKDKSVVITPTVEKA